MIWSCNVCGYEASVGLVVDLRPGDHADCPHCHGSMEVVDDHREQHEQEAVSV